MVSHLQAETSTVPERKLSTHHRESLEKCSGISPEVIEERGYWTANKWQDLEGLAFKGFQKRPEAFPALMIPNFDRDGSVTHHVMRYDKPRLRQNGNAIKYEQPAGCGLRLDVPPRCGKGLVDPERTIYWTEGAKKADALASRGLVAVSTPGVDGWRSPSAQPDLIGIPFKGRTVVCAYDSDVMTKKAVRSAVVTLARWMENKGAEVKVIDWSKAELGTDAKVGVDDYLVDHSLDDLKALVTPLSEWLDKGKPGETTRTHPYRATPTGLVWDKPTKEGYIEVPLANFTATICSDVARDDGQEVQRSLAIEARLRDRVERIAIPASQFASMNWVTECLGAGAIVSPGMGVKDHARAAIQTLSGEVREVRVFTHTGWRQIDGKWVYLHAAGAVGANGAVDGVIVDLPGPLKGFALPDLVEGEELCRAIRSSFALLEVAPKRITVPLLAAVYRAAMGNTDFSTLLVGPSGAGKSELAALVQQHYGPGMDARHLPAAWSSTGNALEALAFHAKDAPLVVDDFAPTGSSADVQRYHRDADRLLRGQGNRSGRQRLNADAGIKGSKSPRGLVVLTGEDVPKGHSLRARGLVVAVAPDDMNWSRLTRMQEAAADGDLARAIVGFVRWLAPKYGDLQTTMKKRREQLRDSVQRSVLHKRTPAIIADLAIGAQSFLAFAQDAGAITKHEANEMWPEWWAALGEAAAAQSQHQLAAEPARRFIELLSAALASGKAHVASAEGETPASRPQAWGHRKATVGTGAYERDEWRPQGDRIGWLDRQQLYLEPSAAFAVAQKIGHETGDGLTVTEHSLRARLKEKGFLESTDVARQTLTIRRVLEGRIRNVLHLRPSTLSACLDPDIPDNPNEISTAHLATLWQTTGAWEGTPVSGSRT